MSKFTIDALVGALSNDKVLEALGTIIQRSLDEALAQKLDSLTRAVEALQNEVKAKNDQVASLTKLNTELKTRLHNQAIHIEKLETYNRQENLIIQGLPMSYAQATMGDAATLRGGDEAQEHSADTEHKFLTFCSKQLGIEIKPTDISICHRLPKSHKQQHQPIIVRFTNRKARAQVLGARKKLRNADPQVFINEHLTRLAATLFASARKLAKDGKIGQVWTRNGQVIVKDLNGDINHINVENDLDQYQ